MIQTFDITDKKIIKKLNMAYKTNAEFAYALTEKKEIKATCLYDINKKTAIIQNISTVDVKLFKTLIKKLKDELKVKRINEILYSQNIDKSLLEKCNLS